MEEYKVLVRGTYSNFEEVPLEVAKEIAVVGAVPMRERFPNGHSFTIRGQKFTVVGEYTPEEFQAAVKRSGLQGAEERAETMITPGYHYLRVSTD
jgi:hypothetical protein